MTEEELRKEIDDEYSARRKRIEDLENAIRQGLEDKRTYIRTGRLPQRPGDPPVIIVK